MTSGIAQRRRLRVRGVVQGVGFRPFVHRLAAELALAGYVGNDTAGVFVEVEGPAASLDEFVTRLRADAPPLARVESIDTHPLPARHERGFSIVESRAGSGAVTLVPPDVALCADCRRELLDPADRRYHHPFVTCTNCGPRFTIVESLPYDRPATTMATFALCARCRAEYDDPTDRRYHAQPIGCHDCGPTVSFWREPLPPQSPIPTPEPAARAEAIGAARALLAAGGIVAVKGLGGYHLACDATNPSAVAELRRRKNRGDKPFAVMVRDLEVAHTVARLDEHEERELCSPANPIVLARRTGASPLAPEVAPGNPLIGVLLPTSGLHHLLFLDGPTALVMTSGNRSGEPIAYDDADAADRLAPLVDAFLTHDRPITVPCDDSVVRVVDGELLPIRRSRGYAPLPVTLPETTPPEPVEPAPPADGPSTGGPVVLAVGGELKNTFCLLSGRHAWLSQHIGDMENLDTLDAFEASIEKLTALYGVRPDVLAADAHPQYLTTAWAHRRPEPTVLVQHHHAHVAAVIAEHGLPLDQPVIGVAFDGTGYGDDGTIWGGEVLVASAIEATRVAHLAPVPLPGGDAAVRHPNRVALAHLRAAGVAWTDDLPSVAATPPTERALLARQLDTGFRCTPTTSMGRLFDAVASLLGVRHDASYEAQAAIELEALADTWRGGERDDERDDAHDDGPLDGGATLAFGRNAGVPAPIDAAPLIRGLVDGLRRGVSTAALAAAFHDAVTAAVAQTVVAVRAGGGPNIVALTGGVFQNARLMSTTRRALVAQAFDVRTHRLVPPNDGGLALGQAVVAAHRRAHRDAHRPARPAGSR